MTFLEAPNPSVTVQRLGRRHQVRTASVRLLFEFLIAILIPSLQRSVVQMLIDNAKLKTRSV